jgi:hypothetical protein
MSFGPTGINKLFYTHGGTIKSGMPYTTWSGGQPGTNPPSQQSSNTCFAQAQMAATISAISTNPQVSKARYKSSLDQLQKHCLEK